MNEDAALASAMRKATRRIIPFLVLLYFIAFLDRVNVSYAALTMNAEVGLSAGAYGLGAGIFFLGYVLFEVPSNLMLARFGARIWIARIMWSWGLVSVAMAFIQGPSSFYMLRFLLGVAEAGFFPGMILYLTYWFPAAKRARILGAFLIAVPASSVIGAPVSTALLGLEAFGLSGWQWLFIIEGVPAILLGFVVLGFLTDRPERARWLHESEQGALVAALDHERRSAGTTGGDSVRRALLAGRVWLLGAIYFGIATAIYGLTLWLPQILKEFGLLTNLQVGWAATIPYAAAAVCMYFWGRRSDAAGERVWHAGLPALVGGAGLAASALLADKPVLAFVALVASAAGMYSALPTFWALSTGMLAGVSAAAAIALINSIGNVGGYAGPVALGYLREATGGHATGLLCLAVACALASTLAVLVGRSAALASVRRPVGESLDR